MASKHPLLLSRTVIVRSRVTKPKDESGVESKETVRSVTVHVVRGPGIPETWKHGPPYLPAKSHHLPRYTLVLDLDKTLVYSRKRTRVLGRTEDFTVPPGPNFNYEIYTYARPSMMKFLEELSPLFEIIVYTTAQEYYGKQVVEWINQKHKMVNHLLHRENCFKRRGYYIKCLARLGRDLSKTVFLDDCYVHVLYNWRNAMQVTEWSPEQTSDLELLQLIDVLKPMAQSSLDDICPMIQATNEARPFPDYEFQEEGYLSE